MSEDPKSASSPEPDKSGDVEKKGRAKKPQRPFPAVPFDEAVSFADEIFKLGSGQSVRRLTLFDHLGKAPDSGASRMLVTNASRYGLIAGNYNSEQLELTPDGLKVLAEDVSPRERARTKVKLAVEDIEPFKILFEAFQNNRLPAPAVLRDKLKELKVPDEFLDEGVETFIVNIRSVRLLQTLSGADRIVTIDHMLDALPAVAERPRVAKSLGVDQVQPAFENSYQERQSVVVTNASFDETCFYITPIGPEGSPERKHSDLFLGAIVEPAVANFGIKVLRADQIDQPGMITRQVMEYIFRSRLVIADLSFHNPNVFYELALRHSTRLPIVQITRARERIPFDIQQMRTIVIDDGDIYSFVPRLESYRADLASQVRRALEETSTSDNPISTYFPGFNVASL